LHSNSSPFHLSPLFIESPALPPSVPEPKSVLWSLCMADLAAVIEARPSAAALLDKKMKKSHAIVSSGVVLVALAVGLGFIVSAI
jgi:hypothetical protein